MMTKISYENSLHLNKFSNLRIKLVRTLSSDRLKRKLMFAIFFDKEIFKY